VIVVIADDLTGAAELGGIGLRYQLKVEINTQVNPLSNADLLIIATDTRSLKKEEAIAEMRRITREVAELKPTLIYKKVDSVLRGHLVAELRAHTDVLGLQGSLLVAANPALNRLIKDGEYTVNNQPLHQTAFANDPDFPVNTSSVKDILFNEEVAVSVLKKEQALPPSGITVAEVHHEDDLAIWAKKSSGQPLLLAGGSGFFSAILRGLGYQEAKPDIDITKEIRGHSLLVCGTAFKKSQDAIRDLHSNGGWVSYMPQGILHDAGDAENLYADWCGEIIALMVSFDKAIIAVDTNLMMDIPVAPGAIRRKISRVVKDIIEQTKVVELLIEGGSTAFAILQGLGFAGFYPVEELAPGVIRMRVEGADGMYLTIKPGSYNWPQSIQNQLLQ